jgi:uncharacterized protein YndB with AHSA1/START domain
VRAEAEITVARPRPEVFAYLRDARQLPEYMGDFESVEQVSEGSPRAGTQYRYRMARGQAEGTFEWTKFVPSSHLAWSGPAVRAGMGSMQPAGWWDLSDAPGGATVVKLVMAPTPGGLFKLLGPFIAAGMRRGNEQALERLKDRLEATGPTPAG